MRAIPSLTRCCLAVVVCAPVSCASRGPSPLTYSVRTLPHGRSATFDAAEVVLTGMGYAIASRDDEAGTLVTAPIKDRSDGVRSRQGRGISSDAPIRRVAEVRVSDSPDGARVYCKVSIQEQTTQAYRLFHSAQSGSDAPGETAIERDAASTVSQNTVWRTVARDKSAERAILTAIAGHTGAVPD